MADAITESVVTVEDIKQLFQWILSEAQSARDEFRANKGDQFNQGMAQAYTEVMDNLHIWCEAYDVDAESEDLEALAVKWFG